MLEHIFRPVPKEDRSTSTAFVVPNIKQVFSAEEAKRFFQTEVEIEAEKQRNSFNVVKINDIIKEEIPLIKKKFQDELKEQAKKKNQPRWIIVSSNFQGKLNSLEVNTEALLKHIAKELSEYFPGFENITVELSNFGGGNWYPITFHFKGW